MPTTSTTLLRFFAFSDELVKIAKADVYHIAGPSGSGKTYTSEIIRKQLPDAVVVDLDYVRRKASRALNVPKNAPRTPELYQMHLAQQQSMVNQIIQDNKSAPIVFGGVDTISGKKGPLTEDTDYLTWPKGTQRIMLNTSPLLSAWRRYRRKPEEARPWLPKEEVDYLRSHPKEALTDIPKNYQFNRRLVAMYRRRGYAPQSSQETIQRVLSSEGRDS